MTKLALAKNAASLVVGLSTTRVVGQIIRNNVDDPESITDQVAIASASFAIGGVVADAAREYTDKTIDQVVEWWQKNVKKDA